ncbi:helix-turn-helix domain-containing protein [Candidatus Poribacteria bacterium]|nr:helix-turn-helix domain-containing protein [Candidatus Poribacteria bacterium]
MTTAKQVDYRPTTRSQRKLLFATWQETGDIDTAGQVARVSRKTCYDWKPRFQQEGFAGLETTSSTRGRKSLPPYFDYGYEFFT